jgi:hypothetical protein
MRGYEERAGRVGALNGLRALPRKKAIVIG